MVLELLEYLAVFAIGCSFIAIYQRLYNKTYIIVPFSKERKQFNQSIFCIFGCLSIFPVVAMYGLRYGIGTDYFPYERNYHTLHSAGVFEYFAKHAVNLGSYYVEPGYYALVHFFPSYRSLLWGTGILIYSLLFMVIKDYSKEMSFAFALFIYLSSQFIYSMNGTRFSIAVCFVLAAYNSLIREKNIGFFLFIVLASLFHKTALICLAMFFLKQYKFNGINSLRNLLYFASILLFPLISSFLFRILRMFPIFVRYFTSPSYAPSASMRDGWTWILHIAVVIVPLLIVARKEIFVAENTSVLFRIYMMELAFRMLGLYNGWYTRLARYADIALVLFLPLVVARVKNKNNRKLLYIYYTAWFVFYFAYYAIVNDQGDSLPYVSIFS